MTRRKKRGWERVGGGSFLPPVTARYPCDEEYENVVTGDRVHFETTYARHCDVPQSVRFLSELDALPGMRRLQCPYCGHHPPKAEPPIIPFRS